MFEDWLDPLGVGLDELCDAFAGSWMFGWADALRASGVHTVIVAITSRVGEPVRRTHKPSGATLWFLPPSRTYHALARRMARTGLQGRRDARSLGAAALAQLAPYLATPTRTVRTILQREGCVSLVCQEYETPRFDVCVAARSRLGLPVLATFQGGDYQNVRLERFVRPWTIRRAAGLVIATGAERARVHARYGVPEARLAAVFNPVDIEFWRPAERRTAGGELVVAWHGQLHPRKGLRTLLRAWSEVRAARPGRALRLLLIGGGEASERSLIRDAAAEDSSIEHVDGWVLDRDRLRTLLAGADVYAFPSLHEGLAVAPLEAMACGLPVVAADAQGVRDLLAREEEDGGVVVPREDASAFAAALGGLIDDDARRATVARNARRRVEAAFAPAVVGAQLREVLVGG